MYVEAVDIIREAKFGKSNQRKAEVLKKEENDSSIDTLTVINHHSIHISFSIHNRLVDWVMQPKKYKFPS